MEYILALNKAWEELAELTQQKRHSLRFLADEYEVDLEARRILSISCNVPAKDHLSILLLHYLIQGLKGLPEITGEWLSFKQLPGGQGYYPAFKKRVTDVILRKCSPNPGMLLELTERLGAKRAQLADFSVVLELFEHVPALITFWRGDQEFTPEANLLFDQSISGIFCTEDIVVLAEVVAHSI